MKKKASPFVSPVRQWVDREIDGESYKLCFELGSIIAAERETGVSLVESPDFAKMTFERLVVLWWACRLPNEPGLTLQEAAASVNGVTYFQIFAACAETWAVSGRRPIEPASESENAQPVAIAS